MLLLLLFFIIHFKEMFLSLACYFWRQNLKDYLKDLHVLFRDMNILLSIK